MNNILKAQNLKEELIKIAHQNNNQQIIDFLNNKETIAYSFTEECTDEDGTQYQSQCQYLGILARYSHLTSQEEIITKSVNELYKVFDFLVKNNYITKLLCQGLKISLVSFYEENDQIIAVYPLTGKEVCLSEPRQDPDWICDLTKIEFRDIYLLEVFPSLKLYDLFQHSEFVNQKQGMKLFLNDLLDQSQQNYIPRFYNEGEVPSEELKFA